MAIDEIAYNGRAAFSNVRSDIGNGSTDTGNSSLNAAHRTLSTLGAMSMICKGQANGVSQGHSVAQATFIEKLFEAMA